MASPNLPFKSFGSASTPLRPSISAASARAQNFNVSKLNQQTERDASAVSMSQVLGRKAGQENSRSTSVAHIGQTLSAASTSITHPGSAVSMNGGEGQDAGADNRRYAYMRKQIMARKAEEAAALKKAAMAKSGLNVGTGAALRTTGTGSVHKELGKEFRGHRSTYGTLSSSEKKLVEDTIAQRLKSKTTGSAVNRYDKLAMKKKISDANHGGDVSFGHAKILKKIVDKL